VSKRGTVTFLRQFRNISVNSKGYVRYTAKQTSGRTSTGHQTGLCLLSGHVCEFLCETGGCNSKHTVQPTGMMKRRTFLQGSAIGIASGLSGYLSWVPRANAATVRKTFYVTEGFITQPDATDVYFQGFSSTSSALNVPGESFVVQEGDTVEVEIINTLSSSHSFVIDGVVNSGTIAPGTSTTVTFTANTAGSYLYYDNLNAPFNRLVGLHGGMAVMPNGSSNELYAGSPTFVQQYFWIMTEVDPVWNNDISNGLPPGTPL